MYWAYNGLQFMKSNARALTHVNVDYLFTVWDMIKCIHKYINVYINIFEIQINPNIAFELKLPKKTFIGAL